MPGRLMHDFRRTAVRNLERAGVPHSVAMKLTGHKADAVFQRYAVAPERDLAEAMTKLVALARRLGPSFPSLPLAEQSNSPQSVRKRGSTQAEVEPLSCWDKLSARGESRTRTGLPPVDFESTASAIPPLGPGGNFARCRG
jgi:hypothetical protein